jgi:zinc protease
VKFSRQPRSWRFYLFPAAKDTPAALETVLKMVEEWRDRGVTPQELDFAKTSLINGAGFLLNTPRKRIENRIQEITLDLPEGFMKHYAEGIARVSVESANASVKAHIHPDQLSILVLGTAKDLKEPLAKAAGVPAEKVQVIDYRQD